VVDIPVKKILNLDTWIRSEAESKDISPVPKCHKNSATSWIISKCRGIDPNPQW